MPRRAREHSDYQHIIVRGNGKQILFECDDDFRYYLSLMRRFSHETGTEILAYCLMDNHVHMMVRNHSESDSIYMKKMGISYAIYYNQKYERTGHLFQDRYKSESITDDAYLLTVFRYILNNPVKAGIARAGEYPWSSYHDYFQTGLSDPGLLREMIGDGNAFLRFMEVPDSLDFDEIRHDDEWAREVIQSVVGKNSGTTLQAMDKASRDKALATLKAKGVTVRQLERMTGINRGAIQRA